MKTLPPLESIPEHLREYITAQDPKLYTYIDHASWRYIMRVSRAFFAANAHPLYLKGLELTGISVDHIPLIDDMDQALRKIGWRAVAINGFIPTAIFLEFQSLRILAIACDMRKLENLGYTPSPDIVHEAAGHAPIVADPSYRAYLEAYGEVARNAIITKYDMNVYDAIYTLSEVKEDPHSTPEEVEVAQLAFEAIASKETEASEASFLARMGWWTTEYGLLGTLEKPLIFGAGLLSSVAESYNCLNPEIKKIPFSLNAVLATPFDITRPQPQLFVAKNFEELTEALDAFANTMAFRRGSVYGLEIAKKAENTVNLTLDNGVQYTGIVSDFGKSAATGEEEWMVLTGGKQIAYLNRATEEVTHHHLGTKLFIPLFEKSVAKSGMDDIQRKLHGSGLHAKGGLRIQGRFKKEIVLGGNARVLILEQVKVTNAEGQTVFEERQKVIPLVLANKVNSVGGGAADRKEFALRHLTRSQKVQSHKSNLTQSNASLNELYHQVRSFRDMGDIGDPASLQPILSELNARYPEDWLLRLELLELFQARKPDSVLTAQLRTQLQKIMETHVELSDMIKRGLELI